jgi:ABC-type uncharacterized transport system ATPase subunit
MQPNEPLRLSLSNITKRYPGVVANRAVSLSVKPGEAHAVLGENGAGKSTLMKIIYGAVKPDEGDIQYNGQAVQIRNPQQARALGISMVFQHFSLFDTLSVAENVWLGLDPSLSLAQVSSRISAKAAEYGLDIDPSRPLILEEPTSVLTPQAVDKLVVVLKKLVSQGCSLLYISHKLHEIRELCSACTVLRGGEVTGVCDPREESNASLSRMMIGAEPPALKHQDRTPGAVLFEARHLTLNKEDQFGVNLADINLQVCAGEVVGIAGVSGNGQRELLYALSGEDTRALAESVLLDGKAVGHAGPQERRQTGLHFVPEERLGRGAVPSLSLAHNLLLTRSEAISSSGWIDTQALQTQAQKIIQKFNVKANGAQAPAQSLSGGNLQKFLVGREIDAKPKVLLVSQPTWGVDVGAAAQIRSELLALRDAGCAVLVVSEELDELFEISDRLYVMANGQISPSIQRKDATVAQIGEWMSGLWSAHA